MQELRQGGTMTQRYESADSYASVAALLWAEREALELVLFKLVEEQLVVSSGSTRWLNRADAELRVALNRLRDNEVARAAEVEALAAELRVPLSSSLADLAGAAPEPWGMVFAEHRTALRSLVFEVEATAAENRRLLEAGSKTIRETLDNLSLSTATYDASGAAVDWARGPFLFDTQA
jgi:hypothetical protein